jgi:hypothetical protein
MITVMMEMRRSVRPVRRNAPPRAVLTLDEGSTLPTRGVTLRARERLALFPVPLFAIRDHYFVTDHRLAPFLRLL